MDVKSLEYLIALEEEGTLSKVAQKFFLSPSALSQCLAKQEREMGLPLFQRNNGRFAPTESGKIYLKCAREIVKIKEATYQQIESLSSARSSLRITAAYQLYPVLTEEILPKLQRLFSDSIFDVQAADSYTGKQYLMNDLADLALLCLPSDSNSLLEQIVLGNDRLDAVVSTSLVADPSVLFNRAADRPGSAKTVSPSASPCTVKPEEYVLSLEHLCHLPFILLKNGSSFRAVENDILAEHCIIGSAIYETDNFFIARDFAQAGNGVAFLPHSMAVECKNCRIIAVVPPYTYHHILAYHKYKPLQAEGTKAVELIADYFKDS